MKHDSMKTRRIAALRNAALKGCVALAVSLLLPAGTQAAFKDAGWGVRPLGMGGAFTAVVNDANAPLFNPAGISQSSCREISFMSARLFTGLEGLDIGLNYLGYLHPVNERTGNFAVAWASLSSPALYREDTVSLSYGRTVNDLVRLPYTDLAVGVNLKYLRHEYSLDIRTKDDPVFANGTAAGAVTADIGIHASWPSTGFSLGLAGKNITSPDVGLRTTDTIVNENVLGVAWYRDRLPYIALPCFTVALDVVSRGDVLDYRAGMETWLFKESFALRAGGRAQELTLGLGYEIEILTETKLIIDYGAAWPLEVEETTGSHRLALSVRFP